MEIWKKIKDYPDYEVSNLGNVKTLEKFINHNWGGLAKRKEKILKHNNDKYGYVYLSLKNINGTKSVKIHRLVAIAFIPNPENKPQVNHINGIKTDNRVENLEWNTIQENITHSVKNGLKGVNFGEENHGSKLTEKEVLEIRNIKGLSNIKIAVKYNVSPIAIGRVIRRVTWKHI